MVGDPALSYGQSEPELLSTQVFLHLGLRRRREAYMKIRTVPPEEMYLELAVGSTVLLIGLPALS
jgi:hypothetical protein